MSAQSGAARYVRVLTRGRPLPDIEGDIARAAGDGVRVLVSTADGRSGSEGLSAFNAGSDSRNAAIAEWAEGLSRQHGLEWRRVERDVLFQAAPE